MKKLYFLTFALICLLGGCRNSNIFAPERLFVDKGGEKLYVANRTAKELIRLNPDFQTVDKKVSFKAPVTDIEFDANGRIWVVTDGYYGGLYEVDTADLSILSCTEIGNTPSAVLFNSLTNTIWVSSRFKNEILEIDPVSKDVLSNFEVGREPVDMLSFASDSLLLVVNNLPEMSSLAFPLAAQLSVVDALSKQVVKRIMLPNGSTDVKAVAISGANSFAYVTHLLARYQLPTNQVDRGWMSTNALSIIDLTSQELINTVLLDTPQKGSANPWGVTVSDDNRSVIVAASGVDELVIIDRNALHNRLNNARRGWFETPSTRKWEDIPNDAGFLYGIAAFVNTEGKGARSVVPMSGKAYVANYFTGEIVELQLINGEKNVYKPGKAAMTSTAQGRGNMYFHDATLGFQGWQSCASCHPNDVRVDGLNWDLLNDGMGTPKNTKTLVLSHKTPPTTITGIRANAEVSVRAGLTHILFAAANEEVCADMDVYIKSVKPEPSPYLVKGKLSEAAVRGKRSFDMHCASCHPGPHYTDQMLYEVDWATGLDKGIPMDVPALNEVWRTAPFLYDGRSYTMREMLDVHGPETPVSDAELNDLTEYILSL